MAKRQRSSQIRASFHYLVKEFEEGEEPEDGSHGFTRNEYNRLLERLRNTVALDDNDDRVIADIKGGRDLPFNHYEEPERGLHFGDFEGAYYGQRYRNNRLGVIDPESLNLRGFHYLVTRLRDGKILVGTTYHGSYGDYDGLKNCFAVLLAGNHRVASKTLMNPSTEIGRGTPISVKLTYRREANRAERRPLFGGSGVLAVTNSDFGDDFGQSVSQVVNNVRGDVAARKRLLAGIVNQGEMITLDEDEIIGCSAVVREDGQQRTVYIIGENNHSTKFPLGVEMHGDGSSDRNRVRDEMFRVMRAQVLPLLAR